MADLHIDEFCRDTAKTLVQLYNRFPQKTIVYVEDIAGADTPDEFGLHSPRFMAGFHTLLWLEETGYITFKQTIRQEAIEDATLSHGAFLFLTGPTDETLQTLLAAAPADAVLNTRIDCLKDTLSHRSSDVLSQLVLNFMASSRQLIAR